MVDPRIQPRYVFALNPILRKTALAAIAATAAFLAGCMESAVPTQNAASQENELAVDLATTSTYQAEAAVHVGAIVANAKTGYTGSGYVDYQNPSNDYIEWTVNIGTAGTYDIVFRYANGSTAARNLKIALDGAVISSNLAFGSTGAWTTWKTVSLSHSIGAGSHKIRATATGTSGPNVDYLQTVGPNTTGGGTAPTVSDLLAVVKYCNEISNGRYATDDGSPSTVPICKLNGAVWWKADEDVDCDGVKTTQCNSSTDPWYQNQTSFTTSSGQWLNSATLPYYVIPLPSSRFDYTKNGIHAGQVAAVITNNRLVYAVFGDEGPSNIIGEASVATANALGVNPDPKNGGSDGPVWYIVFTGSSGVVSPIEDHNKAVSLGQSLASALLKNN